MLPLPRSLLVALWLLSVPAHAAAGEPASSRLVTAPAPTEDSPPERWSWPISPRPRVTRGFAPGAHDWQAGHRGVDLSAAPGVPVSAVSDGVVTFAGMLAGRPVISVTHVDGQRSSYEPVRPGVRAGQRVRRGEPLGHLSPGHAGCPVAACLHLGRITGPRSYANPLLVLGRPRATLLPPRVDEAGAAGRVAR